MRLVLILTCLIAQGCAAHEVVKEEVKYGSHVSILFLCGKPFYMSGANLHEKVRGSVYELSPEHIYAKLKRVVQSAKEAGTVDIINIEDYLGIECQELMEVGNG